MFKLIKILNSGVNVPEPTRIPCSATNGFTIGSAITVEGGLAENCGASTTPLYICAEEHAPGKDSVLCYPIFGNMLFEVEITESPESLTVGDKVTLFVDNNLSATKVTATVASGVATVYDLTGARAAGDKIIVKF